MYKEVMKKACGWILPCMMTVSVFFSCTGKAPEYPDLEGYWKQERIENEVTGERVDCNRLYWALQLGVCEVKDLGGNGYGTYLCRYVYDPDASTLRMYDFRVRSTQSADVEVEKLRQFGIPSKDVTFEVRLLNDDAMVLHATDTTLCFRSF